MAHGYLQLIVRARHMPAANCQLLALPTFQTAMRTSSGLRWLHFALGHKPEPESESIYLQEVINLIHQQSTNRDLICINIYFDTQQSLQNQKPLVFLGVPSLMFPGVSLVFPGVSLVFSDFHGVSSCSTENVLGSSVTKESLQEFFRLQDVINAYRGTSTAIVILDDEYPMFTES
jgi:hypothetical protein